ncbi:hypothetical protein [Bordetella hinzii]|uniref:hypothetical protein n=1 Tax=Bordetella hinzii TaxID=103855 RepID=UPI0012D317CB|nr:hypothetical protein [Bordetella hinzii]
MTYLAEHNYFDGTSIHQEKYEHLFYSLVPEEGESDTVKGETLRVASRIYRDWFNNGFCNITAPHFELMLDFLRSQESNYDFGCEMNDIDVVVQEIEEIERSGDYPIDFEEYGHISDSLESILNKIVLKLY